MYVTYTYCEDFKCQLAIIQNHLRSVSQLRDCLDQVVLCAYLCEVVLIIDTGRPSPLWVAQFPRLDPEL